MVYNGKSYQNLWFGGTLILGPRHIDRSIGLKKKQQLSSVPTKLGQPTICAELCGIGQNMSHYGEQKWIYICKNEYVTRQLQRYDSIHPKRRGVVVSRCQGCMFEAKPRRVMMLGCHLYLHRGSERPRLGWNQQVANLNMATWSIEIADVPIKSCDFP